MFTKNLVLAADGYKYSHPLMYPQGVTELSSYIEERGFRREIFPVEPEVVFMGSTTLVTDYLTDPITAQNVADGAELIVPYGLPFDHASFERTLTVHNGYWAVEVQALPEGLVVPLGIPLVQIRSTDEEIPSAGSFLETLALREIWPQTGVATMSREIKKVLRDFALETGDDISGLDFQLHDFGGRGAFYQETAVKNGMAHLVNFKGTDTVEALWGAKHYFGATNVGFSIPATEHSVATAYGEHLGEYEYVEMVLNLIETRGGLASIVADSYDVYSFVEDILGNHFKERISKLPGKLIVRPDSGDPVQVTLDLIELLGKCFGYTTNAKGFKVLPPYIGLIQGDGVSINPIFDILENFKVHGWASTNIAFGMGGALLSGVRRDDLKSAMKGNEIVRNGVRQPIHKSPKTDAGKASKAGRQAVVRRNGTIVAILETELRPDEENLLKTVYLMAPGMGHPFIAKPDTFENIRERAKI